MRLSPGLLLGPSLLFVIVAPAEGQTQQARQIPTLGILSPQNAPTPEQQARGPFLTKLRELGWIEGQNLLIERAYGEGREDHLPELAEQLVGKRVDVIWASGPDAAVAAARATKTIPIVVLGAAFPVETGLVDSLARPGRNVTGIAYVAGIELAGKQLQLLREIVPGTTRLAWLRSALGLRIVTGGEYTGFNATIESAAERLGFDLRFHRL